MALGRILILTGLAASLAPRAATACKWDKQSLAECVVGADTIFEGRPVARYPRLGGLVDGPGWDYVFVVERQWKGEPRSRQLVFSGYDSCSRIFDRNVSELIFAKNGETWKGMVPALDHQAATAALGTPTFVGEPPLSPPVTRAEVGEDFGWRSSSSDWDAEVAGGPPLSWPRPHDVRDVALIVVGFALALVPLLRERRRAAGRS